MTLPLALSQAIAVRGAAQQRTVAVGVVGGVETAHQPAIGVKGRCVGAAAFEVVDAGTESQLMPLT